MLKWGFQGVDPSEHTYKYIFILTKNIFTVIQGNRKLCEKVELFVWKNALFHLDFARLNNLK